MQNTPIEPSKNTPAFPRLWKRVLFWVLFIILFLGGFAFFINLRLKPFLTRQIKEAIATSTDSLYSISFDNVSVNILTGSATFKNIRFIPDTLVYQKMILKKAAPKHLFMVEVGQLTLRRIHPFKVYFQQKLEMSSLLIDRPKVKMIYQRLSQPQNTVIDNRNAYQRLSKYLRSIKIDDIKLQDADFQYIDKSARRNKLTSLRNLNIDIAGLLIDSASSAATTKLYYTDNISIQMQDYEYRSPNGMYDVKIKEFMASTKDKYAKIMGLRLIPRYNEMQFTEKLKVRAERFALRFDEILLEQIDFKAFNTDRLLVASTLKISNSNSNIFLNKAMPLKIKDRSFSFPTIALRQLNLDTRIDTVFLHNARIAYSEYSPLTKLRGQVFFDQIEGVITNVTNDSAALAKNPNSKTTLTGLVMGRARFNLALDLKLTDQFGAFKLNGSLGNMNASLFNQILRPLTLVQVRTGFIEEMQFSFNGNVKSVQGKLSAKYNDLKISILSKKENSSKLKKMGIASMAANVLFLKSENPSPGQRLRTAKIDYSRPDSASFINMNWKGMVTGLRDLVGLDPKTQRIIEIKLREFKIVKAEREIRREERIKRREVRKQNNRR